MPHFVLRLTKNYKPIKLKYNQESVRETRYLQNLALEDVFKELAWEKKEIRIDRSHLNNLRFAEDPKNDGLTISRK